MRVSGKLSGVVVVGACEEALADVASIVPTSVCTEVWVGKESVLDDATPNAYAPLEDGGGGGGSVVDEACMSLEEERTAALFSRARLRSTCCRRRGAALAPNMSGSAGSDEVEACCNSCTRAGSCIP